jgi:hypothetical protein
MHTCRTCRKTKSLSEFDIRADTGRYRTECKECRRLRQRVRTVAVATVSADLKRCTRCGETKSPSEFPLIRRGGNKRQSWCRACFAVVNAAYYARNHDREKARLVMQVTRRRAENRRNIIAYLLAHPCVECGERDIVVLEFDHRDEKIADISTYANSGRTWPTILKEIEKCDVRCVNCHRRATARRTVGSKRAAVRPRKVIQLDLETASLTRECRVCGAERPLSEFPLRFARTGIRHHICLSCQREVAARWYTELVGRPVRAQRPRGAVSRAELAARVFSYLAEHPCVDCGEADPIVLEFDHRRDKIADVATLVHDRHPWEAIAVEIAKCEVRCGNCHRRRTVGAVRGYRLTTYAATPKGLEPLAY